MNPKELVKLSLGTVFVLVGIGVFTWWSSDTAAGAFKEWLYWIDIVADHHPDIHPVYLPLIFK